MIPIYVLYLQIYSDGLTIAEVHLDLAEYLNFRLKTDVGLSSTDHFKRHNI